MPRNSLTQDSASTPMRSMLKLRPTKLTPASRQTTPDTMALKRRPCNGSQYQPQMDLSTMLHNLRRMLASQVRLMAAMRKCLAWLAKQRRMALANACSRTSHPSRSLTSPHRTKRKPSSRMVKTRWLWKLHRTDKCSLAL